MRKKKLKVEPTKWRDCGVGFGDIPTVDFGPTVDFWCSILRILLSRVASPSSLLPQHPCPSCPVRDPSCSGCPSRSVPLAAGHPSRLHRLSCLRRPSRPRRPSYPHRPSCPRSESLHSWLLCLQPATTDTVLVLAPSWILEALAATSSAISAKNAIGIYPSGTDSELK
jgi:hypothetical protein